MARGKVQMKRIENPVHRQVTFCKRRAGLLKKAKELSVLCDAEIGLVIISSHGKIYELATKGMQGLIERYMKSTRSSGSSQQPSENEQQAAIDQPQPALEVKEEINVLKQEIEILQKGLRCMFGGGANGMITLDELLILEKHLEEWIYHIRSAKMDIMLQEIQLLRNQEGILTAANKHLLEKIEENYIGTANFAPVITNFPYPLTIQNEIFQF
ncbi:agamous-like MADS-box protein AGL12 isoform X2 [Tripterygium wilfordii]|uniref:agamous-like MADS-box protein AGL12 isoform X2 n=1 Tax=Tripterygium wilfordii TaxID=458696 RepID=UPI0018F8462E|nr:agamous-like MADS-box protein AGL12 isoform X2 [Tripterygium wilfordii]